MSEQFQMVKDYLNEMNLAIVDEDPAQELVVVENEEEGIKNLIIDCEPPIVIIEQFIMRIKAEDAAFYRRLLQMNRELVHGAFVLDDTGELLLFRDTLQLANLDYNELEGSINSLSLAMSEYGSELLEHHAA